MSDKIVDLFQFLESSLGMHPATVAVNALLLTLVFAVLAVFLALKLRGARSIVRQLAERLGYDPSYGNGIEILDLEHRKEQIESDKEEKIEQLEQRVGELEAEGANKDAYAAALEQRGKGLEEQLRQAALRHDEMTAQAEEQARVHQRALEQLEQRMRDLEAESYASVASAELRAKELEDKLHQANLWSDKVAALANDQAQAHQRALEQFEQHTREMEANHIADLTASQRRSKDLEEQLHQAGLQNERVKSQVGEQAQAHQITVSQFEERIRQMEAEGNAFVTALERRSKELEEQLHQAFFQNDQLASHGEEQAKAHRAAVELLEQRMRDVEADSNAYVASLQVRSKDLEEQLQRAAMRHERVTVEAGEQIQAYRLTVDKLEQRMREMEAAGGSAMAAAQERAKELEDQLQRARVLNEQVTAQAGEQVQAHRETVEQLERRMREMEAAGAASMAALEQRSKELEDQLQRAHALNEQVAAQAGEQAQAHRETVGQLEQRMREMEAGGAAAMAALQERSKELEEQLQRAHAQNEQASTQAGEQAQAHREAVERLEQSMREKEAAGAADLAALRERSKELEDQLQQTIARSESEKASARQEALELSAGAEQLGLRIRGLESEKDARESHLRTLEAQVRELEEHLNKAASQATVENARVPANASEQFMRRAEWITACAVGTILPYGLVAAEAYASAALVANPQGTEAPQLLAELARIRRAYPEGLPSVVEALATFDERTAAFFAANLARSADIAEDEAQRRYRAGLNRSALLVTNVALELRLKSEGEESPGTVRLQELQDALLARLGNNALYSDVAPRFESE